MEISALLIRVFLLFLPGIIAKLIIDQLTTVEEKRIFFFLIYSFVLGFFSYITYGLIIQVLQYLCIVPTDIELSFIKSLLNEGEALNVNEIGFTSVWSIFLGLFSSFIINKKFFHRVSKTLGITHKFAATGVWGHVFESEDPTDWVFVRDHKYNLVYFGWVDAFSEKVDDCELLLRDVEVYDNIHEGEKLYTTPAYYLARNRNEISIEFPKLEYVELKEEETNE